jgi:kynureninase
VADRVAGVVTAQWGTGLIGSWNSAGWIGLHRSVGAKIGRLVGAQEGEVIAADSTSVNLFKLLVAAHRMRPERRVILTERGNFPTDGYIVDSVARMCGLEVLRVDPDRVLPTIGAEGPEIPDTDGSPLGATRPEDIAVVVLTHVDYRTGRMHDLPTVTRAAQSAGALMLWDLAHSAGAVPVDLTGAGADLAVGCSYKYLNGGPGAPAFAFVARRLQDELDQPLTGWLGHQAPFALEPTYRPAVGIDRAQCGTPPVLSLAALDAALDAFDGVSMRELRAKSLSLTELFIALVDARVGSYGIELASPRDGEHRGSQVSVRHPHAYEIVQALIARGVVGDFRAPDLARFGFAPLYLRHVDVWDAVEHLLAVVADEEFRRPEHGVRFAVT